MQVKKQQLEPDMEQWTGKEYVKAVYCHPAYLTYMQDLAVVPREKPHTGAAAREQPRDSPVIER